jgi:hypothetical protein
MIWFACPKCGKVHGRQENASGAMVFCDCGQGLTVPWESTAPEPADLPAVAMPSPPRREPLSFGEPAKPRPPEPLPPARPGRRGSRYQHDPNVCFNHESRPKQRTCDECDLPFCDDCVLTFRGQTLCGPCKNYQAKLLQRPPQTSGLALASLLVAVLTGPLVLCLLPVGARNGMVALSLFALVPHAVAFTAGLFALRSAQSDPGVGGQGLAITGMLTASFSALVTIALTLYAPRLGA